MNEPFFSVIVPEHNSSEFMQKGLDSIKRQVFTDYELLIICDACTDNTAEIAREYTDKVFEINAQRCGLARNKGLEEAKGKWILFMDDDDWYMDCMAFQAIADAVGQEDVLAYGFYWKNHGSCMNRPEQLYTAVWNKAWRRSFIEEHGFRFPDWKHSDDDGFHRLVIPKARIAYLNQCLYYYNFLRPGSLTWQIEKGMLDGHIPGR